MNPPHKDDDDGAWSDPSFLSALGAAESDGLRRLSQGLQASTASGNAPCGAGYDSLTRKRGREELPPPAPSESFASNIHASSLQSDVEVASKPTKLPQAAAPEGEYMAALRGAHSESWQSFQSGMVAKKPGSAWQGSGKKFSGTGAGAYAYGAAVGASANSGGAGPADACYKCGKEGHWAKDCPLEHGGKTYANASGGFDGGAESIPDRSCPCGGGVCLVLTANTEKNPGRKFYRCPLRKEEGQCGFFEWCDAGSTSARQGFSGGVVSGSKAAEQEMMCPCGAGLCAVLTAKTEKNMGRLFFRCPMNQEEGSCRFFKWCDEAGNDGGTKTTGYSTSGAWSKDYSNRLASSNMSTQSRSSGAFGSSGSSGYVGSGGSVTCYKCGQAGHFSKDCSNQQWGTHTAPSPGGNTESRSCYKCGGKGHWSSNCPNSGFNSSERQGYGTKGGSGFGRGSGVGGSCYKCGEQGHWANNCTGNRRAS